MRKLLLIVLLITTAGCATLPAPEPALVEPVQSPQTFHAEPAPMLPPEKTANIVTQPASPAPGQGMSRPLAVEKEPKHHPAAARRPEEVQPPVVASKQPETPAREQKTNPSAELREIPVPDHNLRSLAEFAASNDDKMMNVYVGMNRKTVEMIMGPDNRNPYRKTTIMGAEGQVYEVLFYLTREPRQGKPITNRMLTPIIIRKGRVVAMGNYKLKKLISNGTLERRRPALSIQ
jgi:hypothetical protein